MAKAIAKATGETNSKSPRDQIRAKLLGPRLEAKSTLITVFDVELEMRQPTLGSILMARDEDDPEKRVVDMIIKYAYVPGTNDLVFEPEDLASILNWPFGEDLLLMQRTITELTGVNIDEAEEDLQKHPLPVQQ